MTRIIFRNKQGLVDTNLQVEDLSSSLNQADGLVWLDFSGKPMDQAEWILNKIFNFHPLAIDDALHENHVPNVNDWEDYLYIALRAVNYANHQLEIPELDIFLGANYIVTCSEEPIPGLDRIWEICQKDQRWTKQSTGDLLYRLTDELISDAVQVVEVMEDELEDIEGQLFSGASPDVLERLFTLKRNILQLRRMVAPQKDVLNKLTRKEYPVINPADRIFFRDVFDHLLQLDSLLDDMIILVGGALDTYLSVVNNQMNDIMKTLTIITAFFMPLTFITGFFGMNFFYAIAPLEAWTGNFAFIIVLASMFLIPLIMFSWMRHRTWI
jgi:magnesium transporter